MKTFLAVIILFGLPLFANEPNDDSFDLGLDPVTSEELNVDSVPAEKAPTSPAIKSEVKQNRSIYIVNQASSGAKAGAKTETEQNDTTELNSRADELKKHRHRAETETELKATEKIEESRLNDERRRSDVLFGERFKSLESSGNTTPTPSPQPVYIPVPQPQIQQTLDKIEFHDDKKIETFEKEAQKKSIGSSKTYFIGLLGLTEFPKADNIQGNGTFGIGLGVEAQERIFVEGMFQYASYKGTYPTPANIDEYSGIGAIKFQFSKGTIRPIAGALAVYSYRSYMYNYGGYQSIQYQQQSGSQQSNSSVLDAGLLGGAQFSISDDFAIGAEFRYLWNLTSKTDGYYPSFYPNQQPLDSFSHYIFAITGKFNF